MSIECTTAKTLRPSPSGAKTVYLSQIAGTLRYGISCFSMNIEQIPNALDIWGLGLYSVSL